MRLAPPERARARCRRTAVLLTIVSGCDLWAVAATPPARAVSPLVAPGQLGVYADTTGTANGIGPELPGEIVCYVVVRPPQTGMESCSFNVYVSVGPAPVSIQRQLAPGIEDLDPSADGYDLRFPGGCLGPAHPNGRGFPTEVGVARVIACRPATWPGAPVRAVARDNPLR